MKVAIATDGQVCSDHFGHCEGFTVYEIMNKQILKEYFIKNPGHSPGFLPNYLKGRNINVIISASMGERAQSLFNQENIEVIVGAYGNIKSLINDYLEGMLISDNSICQKHEFDNNCNE